MHDFRHNIDYVIIGKNMSKNSKKHKDNIAHKSLSLKPVIIGFFIIVLLVFALMMYKYRVIMMNLLKIIRLYRKRNGKE